MLPPKTPCRWFRNYGPAPVKPSRLALPPALLQDLFDKATRCVSSTPTGFSAPLGRALFTFETKFQCFTIYHAEGWSSPTPPAIPSVGGGGAVTGRSVKEIPLVFRLGGVGSSVMAFDGSPIISMVNLACARLRLRICCTGSRSGRNWPGNGSPRSMRLRSAKMSQARARAAKAPAPSPFFCISRYVRSCRRSACEYSDNRPLQFPEWFCRVGLTGNGEAVDSFILQVVFMCASWFVKNGSAIKCFHNRRTDNAKDV
jgi:hypothetical protein